MLNKDFLKEHYKKIGKKGGLQTKANKAPDYYSKIAKISWKKRRKKAVDKLKELPEKALE